MKRSYMARLIIALWTGKSTLIHFSFVCSSIRDKSLVISNKLFKGDIQRHMEKRAYNRIPVCMEVEFCCGSRVHNGTVMNISEKGMFIITKEMSLPLEPQWEVRLPFKGETLSVPVSLRRMEMSPDSHDGIGVEFTGPSGKYHEFVNSLRSEI